MMLDIYLKPSLLRGWSLVRETPKCLVVSKVLGRNPKFRHTSTLHVPRKSIVKVVEVAG